MRAPRGFALGRSGHAAVGSTRAIAPVLLRFDPDAPPRDRRGPRLALTRGSANVVLLAGSSALAAPAAPHQLDATSAVPARGSSASAPCLQWLRQVPHPQQLWRSSVTSPFLTCRSAPKGQAGAHWPQPV